MAIDHTDVRVAELAGRQHGVVTRAQLIGLGLSRRAVEHRLARGRLHALHRGVYVVGHVAAAAHAGELAAVLACGNDAYLSSHAAGGLLGITRPATPPFDVTVVRRDPGRRAGIRIHVIGGLDPRDVQIVDGIPVTGAARTVLDLAAALDVRDLRWAVEEARIRRLARTRDLEAVLGRYPRRRGAASLRAVLTSLSATPQLTRSKAERLLLDLIRDARLPSPLTNVRLEGWEVDLLWRTQRLVVEMDGFETHRTREAFERDRRRDGVLQAAGFRVIRLTWRRVTDEPLAVAALLARLLADEPVWSAPASAS